MNWQSLSQLLGRVLLGAIYVASGISKITGWAPTHDLMASHGFPMVSFFEVGAILIEIGCGTAVIVGFMTRPAALILAAYTIAATVIFNQFWTMQGDMAAVIMHLFMATVVMLGGCLFIAGTGPGAFALDNAGTRKAAATAAAE
jgi:putative oxidoreductase